MAQITPTLLQPACMHAAGLWDAIQTLLASERPHSARPGTALLRLQAWTAPWPGPRPSAASRQRPQGRRRRVSKEGVDRSRELQLLTCTHSGLAGMLAGGPSNLAAELRP